MDPLSEILSLLKPRSYITAGFDAGGDWSLRLDDLAGRIKCYAVMRGSCWLALEDAGEPVQIVTGDCFVLPSGCPVRISSDPALAPTLASEALAPDRDGETVIYNGGGDVLLTGSRFEVSGRHADVLLRTLPPVVHLKAAADQATLRWSIELMMQELREAQPGASLVAQHLAHIMLTQTLRLYLTQQSGTEIGLFAGLADPNVGSAIGAIHADPSRGWTLEELAVHVGMSRTVFARRFREKTGETPVAYLTRWRMMLAAERLASGSETLAHIARAVGYESENAFNTAFTRVMGLSPRRYSKAVDARSLVEQRPVGHP
ncbi:AraC family transcriptional regulator [Rhizobium sp. TRM96647]|uniref:AraC family transcriptional regulator n=1 Tax=unclassified Rhizobium TaxID=2613769 RepID=UPI0021E98BFC|nr:MULTISPECIES: AraC family transcriptional regulator [unclassified Rhizobium]MCV3738923.1 AraC family transcriptional regulator [Rhizobium sp. TRM96647]MCV3760678.1 AraC family transcriptional regulator [Rhizobium sp. TRM96650]